MLIKVDVYRPSFVSLRVFDVVVHRYLLQNSIILYVPILLFFGFYLGYSLSFV